MVELFQYHLVYRVREARPQSALPNEVKQDRLKRLMATAIEKLASEGPFGLAGQLVTIIDKEGEEETSDMLVELVDRSTHSIVLIDLNNSEITTRRTWEVINYKNLSTR